MSSRQRQLPPAVAERLGIEQPRMINQGGWANGDAFEAVRDGQRVVVKTYCTRGQPIRRLGRYLLSRERRAYAALAGIEGVPRLYPCDDQESLIIEYIPSTMINKALRGPHAESIVASLQSVIAAMHQRRVYHLDLRNRGNVLVDDNHRAFVLDFSSSIVVGNLLTRLIEPFCRWFDHYGVSKWAKRAQRE